jgi:hypothetical protein
LAVIVPIVYLRTVWRASAGGEFWFEFNCSACGFACEACVPSHAEVEGATEDGALNYAHHAAVRNAQDSLRFVRCPSCERRNFFAVLRSLPIHLFIGALFGLGLASIAWGPAFIIARLGVTPLLLVCVPLAVIAWVAFVVSQRLTQATWVRFQRTRRAAPTASR